jgi:GT2 family glycosyltransferase/glycosyltransferase involved in cell wall biosynthesis
VSVILRRLYRALPLPFRFRFITYHFFLRFSSRFVDYWQSTRDFQLVNESKKIRSRSNTIFTDEINHGLYSEIVSSSTASSELSEFRQLRRTHPPDNVDGVKLMTYYLPQFHPIIENDEWWGAGFTEWRNVTRAFPVYVGHYQPRRPGELGYYDLRVPDVMRRQVELAKLHGIHGFTFYFYWFGGKTLLELPLRKFLQDDLNLNFSLCWANENWSRRWDGSEEAVLISQSHSPKDDEMFLEYVSNYFKDSRYLKVRGKPVLTIYRPLLFPNLKETTDRWRRKIVELGFPGIYLIATDAFGFQNYKEFGFDAITNFPPHGLHNLPNVIDSLDVSLLFQQPAIRHYKDAVDSMMHHHRMPNNNCVHPGVMLAWDNSARKPFLGNIFHGFSPELFYSWLKSAISFAKFKTPEERFVFINAWNEWAEGSYLEPDLKFGYANLEMCARAISNTWDKLSGVKFLEKRIEGQRDFISTNKTILVVTHYNGARSFGAERSLLHSLRALADSGMNVIVTSPNVPLNLHYLQSLLKHCSEILVFPYSQWGKSVLSEVEDLMNFTAVIEATGAQLIYVNTGVLKTPLWAAKYLGIPSVAHVREIFEFDAELLDQIKESPTTIKNFLMNYSDAIIVNSENTKAQFSENAEIICIPNVIEPPEKKISEIGVAKQIRFALISNNLPKKGISDFLILAQKCENLFPDAKFLLIGPRENLRQQPKIINEIYSQTNLEVIDYIDSPWEAMNMTDVVVNLSNFKESFGRSVLEAMVAGRPVLVYQHGALPEVVGNSGAGLIVSYRDIDGLVDAIGVMCDRSTLLEMSRNARIRAEEFTDLRKYDYELSTNVLNLLAEVDASKPVAQKKLDSSLGLKTTVEVIVCVHNALASVSLCLESIDKFRSLEYGIVIVDDCSEVDTATYLEEFASTRSYVRLIRSDLNLGYTRAANMAAQSCLSEFLVFLNSDTLVGPFWVEKMIGALRSKRGAVAAGPLSNAAGLQSIPDARDGEFNSAINSFPPEWTVEKLNEFCDRVSSPRYPTVPILHGFCFVVLRKSWNLIGQFDEKNFSAGYGEETDFFIRALNLGFTTVLATNTFVHHSKSQSYGDTRRAKLVQQSQKKLYEIHGKEKILTYFDVIRNNKELDRIRKLLQEELQN